MTKALGLVPGPKFLMKGTAGLRSGDLDDPIGSTLRRGQQVNPGINMLKGGDSPSEVPCYGKTTSGSTKTGQPFMHIVPSETKS